MSPSLVEYWIVRLRRGLEAAEASNASLTARVAVLEGILLNVPGDRLLGRHAATTGPAQAIRIGTGLDLVDDVLTNTCCGDDTGVVDSFTLICLDDSTEHVVRCVFDQDEYTLEVVQSPGGADPVAGKTFIASDSTNHVLRLRLDQGFYVLEVVQSPGGTGAMASVSMNCAQDATVQDLTIVLDQGFYTTTFE